jgi:ATP-binding cassette subfamily C protein
MLLINKTLLKMAKGLWGWIFIIMSLKLTTLVGTALFAQVAAGFLASLADFSINQDDVGRALLSAFLASLVALTGEILVGESEYRCTAKARILLRRDIFSKILLLGVANIETLGMSRAIASAVDGVEYMQVYYSKYLPSLLYCFVAPIFLFGLIARASIISAVLFLIVSLLIFPANNIFRKTLSKLNTKVWENFGELTGYYLESLSGLPTLKLFNQDEQRELRLREKAENFSHNTAAMFRSNFMAFLFTDSTIYLTVFISVAIVSFGLSRGNLSLRNAIVVLMLGYGFFSSIRQLMVTAHQALSGIAAAQDISELLDIDTSRPVLPWDDSQKSPGSGIKLENVSFSYAGRDPVIRGVTVEIQRDKVTAVVGASGSGKSSICGLLTRFFDPSSGRITLDGVDYACYELDELRKLIVMVPQQVGVFSGTIAENLRIAAPEATDAELVEALRLVRLGEWLSEQPDGLQADVGDAGGKLSGGQKQKLGIARVLLQNAPYIIFDEATSSVDVESERDIWSCIADLSRTRTLIIISHRLSTIRMADRIYVLSKGKIEEAGSHDELMENFGLYYGLVTEQAELELHGLEHHVKEAVI